MSAPEVLRQTTRRWVMTGAVAAVAITGSIYGAGLKSRQELKQERQRFMEATPEERIAQLEAARTELVRKKTELERKLSDLSARRQGLQGSKSEGNR